MKFSVISTLLMAAVPALAETVDYTLSCNRHQYNSNVDNEGRLYSFKYANYCIAILGCQSYSKPKTDYSTKRFVGECLRCPSGKEGSEMEDGCTLVYKKKGDEASGLFF
ncbi:hypothetical protein E4U54_001316 [Claviceps lovelessii]|nr:hypothetical protein E4U54_001316 [Claviceps lovelessii]